MTDRLTGGDGVPTPSQESQPRTQPPIAAVARYHDYFGIDDARKGELEVRGDRSPLTVARGFARIHNLAAYMNTERISVYLPTPERYERVDAIVLRADWQEQTIRVAVVRGVGDGAKLTQEFGVRWEMLLATATVRTDGTITVTDCREFTEMD